MTDSHFGSGSRPGSGSVCHPPASLCAFPPAVLATLFQLEPSLMPLFLVRLGSRRLHLATRRLAYAHLTFEDSQDLLGSPSKLATVLYGPQDYGLVVHTLVVLAPTGHPHHRTPHEDDDTSMSTSPSSSPSRANPNRHQLGHQSACPDPHPSYFLAQLLARVTNLKHFEWASDRLPMPQLCSLLGTQCPNLEHFILNLSHTNDSARTSLIHPAIPPFALPGLAGHDHGLLENPWTRQRAQQAGTVEDPDSDSSTGVIQAKPLRWDADAIDSLPAGLSLLHISSLSSSGSKRLASAFEAMTWTSLTELKLSNTLFVDDELMGSITTGSKKIKAIRIESMSGTKLTERGVEVLFNCLDELEKMEIIDVEGRFSKSGWLKLEDLPPSLKSLKFGYYEIGSYHSWTLEHLNNILSLLSLYPKQLQTLSIKRFSPYPALVPGRHATFSELGVGTRTCPKKMTKEQIMAIVEDGASLRVLEIDWWLISVEGLEVIVKGLPELVKLRVLVDAPFHRIIGSTAFVHSKIRVLTVSIPPEHTPSLAKLVSPTATTNGCPPYTALRSTPTSPQTSYQYSPPLTTGTSSYLGVPQIVSPVPVRDIKKFIKRAGHLREIIWTGRGGLGNYKFTRTCASAVNVKVEFVPITEYLPTEAFEYETSSNLAHHHSPTSMRRNSLACGTSLPAPSGRRVSSTKSRTFSITNTFPNSTEVSSIESRRSSEASLQSLATSWGSTHNNSSSLGIGEAAYLKHSVGLVGKILNKKKSVALEGIPGTPVCEEQQGESELSAEQLGHLDLAFA